MIKPKNKTVKNAEKTIIVEGTSYENLKNQLTQRLNETELKEYKTGYETHITLPSSDSKNATPIKHNGELQSARFSLDNPDNAFSSFKQKDVDRVNKSLEKYFKSFDK